MKTLPQNYAGRASVAGYHFKLVERNDCAAIYSQSRHPDLPADGVAAAYEVVLIRMQPPRHTGSFQFVGGECLPNDEQWGQLAWTCNTLDRARAKFAEVSTPARLVAARAARDRIAAMG